MLSTVSNIFYACFIMQHWNIADTVAGSSEGGSGCTEVEEKFLCNME
jgi:hypothetical protein